MTDRLAGVLVTFDDDYRDDDAAHILAAIQMIKGVSAVEPVPSDYSLHIATERAKREIKDKLWDLVEKA
jgi:hypothetical protein